MPKISVFDVMDTSMSTTNKFIQEHSARFEDLFVTRRQFLQRDPYMHFALPEQLHLARRLVLHETQRRVFFGELRNRGRHAHFIFAVAHLQRQSMDRLRRGWFR